MMNFYPILRIETYAKLYLPIRNSQDKILQGNVDNSEIWAVMWDINFNTKK